MKENKRFSLKLPAKASVWYLFLGGFGKAIGFLTTPFFTRLFSSEVYGEITMYLTLLGIATVVGSIVSTGSAFYKGLNDFKEKKEDFLKSSLAVSLAFYSMICILLFAFSPFLHLKPFLLVPLTIQILCDAITSVALSSARFSYRYKEVVIIGLISAAFPPIATLLAFYLIGTRFKIRIYAMLAVSVCSAIYGLLIILSKKGRANKKMSLSLCKSALPLLPHSLSTAISTQADKLILTSFMGAISLAKYAVVHSLGVALQFAVNAVGSALGPWMIRRLGKGERKEISRLLGLLFSGFSALSLCLIAFAPEAMKILAPTDYLDAFPALLPIALTTPFVLLSSVITIGLVHSERGGSTATVSLVSLAVSLILNFTLIPKSGYLGAGLSVLFSQISAVAIGGALLYKAKISEMLPTWRLVKIIMPSLVAAVVLFLLFESLALRVLLLIIPATMCLNAYFKLRGLILE